MFAALGKFTYRRRWWVIGGWAVVLLAGVLLSGPLFDRLRTVDALSPDAESMRADAAITAAVADGPVVFAVIRDVDVYDPPLVEAVSRISGEIRGLPGVVEVRDLYTSPGGRIGADNRSTLVQVEFAEDLPESELAAAEDDVRAKLHAIPAPSVLVGGDHLAERAFGEQAVRDLAVGESIAFALLLIALVVIFGGVLAASLPIAVAVAGVTGTFLVLLGVSTFTEVGDYSLNIVTLLGLGLAVDYALLIVARYREELAGSSDVRGAVIVAVSRAGRAVAISGLAVAVALTGLALFAEPLLASMAVGGTAVVLLTTLLAITLVPALLAVAGARIPPAGAATWVTRLVAPVTAAIRARRLRSGSGRTGAKAAKTAAPVTLLVRLASLAQRRPVAVAVGSALGMLVLAAPLLVANFGNSDARALPAGAEERQAYEAYQELIAQHALSPVTLVAQVDAASAQVRDYLNRLNVMPQVERLEIRPDLPPGVVIIDLVPSSAADGAELVRAVRADRPDFPLRVTGEAAKVVDYQRSVGARLPLVVTIVVLATLVLLYLLTRSVLVPIKAVLLAALTFLSTLGALVAIFGWGWGEAVLGFDSWGALDLTTPLLLFVFIFGLAMDYEVFLLARIKEEYDGQAKPNNDRAVLAGIARSGPVVTAAALCITIVFVGFAVGGLVPLKEIGVGMAIAVILDVTVVRGLLLPAVMSLLGDLNWWSPLGRRG